MTNNPIPFKDLAVGDHYRVEHEAQDCVFEKLSNETFSNVKLIKGNWVSRLGGRIVMRVGEKATAMATEPVIKVEK